MKKDGTLWGWGYNGVGSLGNGTRPDAQSPVQVPSLPPIVSVSVRSGSVYAVDNAGSVWAWGNNYMGVLGDGTETNALHPIRLELPDVAAKVYTGGYTTYVLTDKGTVWSWGDTTARVLGINDSQDLALLKTAAPVEGHRFRFSTTAPAPGV